ncbi:MAG: cytochrome C oxidase subunit IV family protein [Hyphomicrobiales bacterium]
MKTNSPHKVNWTTNIWVWAVLLVFTLITVTITRYDFMALTVAVALTIALIKSVIVAIYFMHLKFTNAILSIFFGIVVLVFLSFIIFTFVDYSYRI